MPSIALPYTASATAGEKRYDNLEVTKINKHTTWVRLPNGMSVKCHNKRRNVKLTFFSTEL